MLNYTGAAGVAAIDSYAGLDFAEHRSSRFPMQLGAEVKVWVFACHSPVLYGIHEGRKPVPQILCKDVAYDDAFAYRLERR